MNIVIYDDQELSKLKNEARNLETDFNFKSDELSEIEKIIRNFSIKQNQELGEILNNLLKYRKEKLEAEKDTSKKKKKEFEEAKAEYEEFNENYEFSKTEKLFELTDDEKIEIKKAYRKATKLCHPDIVSNELKNQAEEIFNELKKAYEENNIKKVKEILENLEKGNLFVNKSESITEISKLKVEIIKLKTKLEKIISEIENLKSTDPYLTIIKIEDWDNYFKTKKNILTEELNYLQNNG